MILNLYKPLGLTPLQLIDKAKIEIPEISDQKFTYAGRLDPMAEGVLILLSGKDIIRKNEFLNLPKTYQFKIALGIETDTYDILGLIQERSRSQTPLKLKEKIKEFMDKSMGKHIHNYPPFSSKSVNGKPLFQWAKEDKLGEIEIPSREVQIYKFELEKISDININNIRSYLEKIEKVKGDFRQKEILNTWNQFLKKNPYKKIKTIDFEIKCSSGTYVRNLAYELGNFLGTGAIALSIKRTSVGDFKIEQSKILHF